MTVLEKFGNTYYYPDARIPALVRHLMTKSVLESVAPDGKFGRLIGGRGAIQWVNNEMDQGRRLVVAADILEGGDQTLHTVQVPTADGKGKMEDIYRASSEPTHGIVMETGFMRAPGNPLAQQSNNPNILVKPAWGWVETLAVGAAVVGAVLLYRRRAA